MAITQGDVLPDVTKTATVTQQAPDWYSNYLQQSAGNLAAAAPQFVGATGNQQQAFDLASKSAGAWGKDLEMATNLVGKATDMSAFQATSPYLQKASGISAASALAPYAQQSVGMSSVGALNPYAELAIETSGAKAFDPYAQKAGALSAAQAATPGLEKAGGNVYDVVSGYMNPYTSAVVNEIGRLGQENITRNLAPAAVSGAAGTGQFGSRRGAQVLGNVIQDALADVSGKQSQALFSGYEQATKAAQTDMARQLQAAVASGQMTDADAARILQAGTTAGQLTTTDANKILQAGISSGQLTGTDAARILQAGIASGQLTDADVGRILQSGELAGKFTASDMASLLSAADVSRNIGVSRGALNTQDIANLLKTGEVERGIGMEEQMFPITTEQQKLNAIRGLQLPMGQTTTTVGPEPGSYQTSPLSNIAGIGTMLGQLFGSKNQSAIDNIGRIVSGTGGALSKLFETGIYSPDFLDSIGATSNSPWVVGSDLVDYTGDQGIDWSQFV